MRQEVNFNATYTSLFNATPPSTVTLGISKADIISPGRGFMDAFDFTMQLQVGCPGGCLFCYVPPAYNLTPASVRGEQGRTWGFVVRNKDNVANKLKKHLHRGTLADKTIYWSGVTDPYAASPVVTRELWQTLLDTPTELRPRRIAVQSRFRPDRDANLMKMYSESTTTTDGGPPVLISYSVGTDQNDLIRAWEKATPSFEQRMKTVENLRLANIFVVVTLSPLGLWHDLSGTLQQFKTLGVAYVTGLFFKQNTPSAVTPRLFLKYLNEEYPMVLDEDWQAERVEEMQTIYGNDVLIGKVGFESLARPHEFIG